MRTIQTSAIIGKIKVFYEYQEDEKSNTLNQLGQYYRRKFIHSNTQRFMESYLNNKLEPTIGEVINSDKTNYKLKIIDVIFNYKRTTDEKMIYKLEKEFLKQKPIISRNKTQ
tara:strand:- start:264 stop:599 length:336 start_codon:yes stop_codon:yes gene_type:complete